MGVDIIPPSHPVLIGDVGADREIRPAEAAVLLRHWGFLAGPDLPDRPGPGYLLVALREQPTLEHFDPELAEYWVTRAGRGERRTLTHATTMPIETEFSWGLIRIVDRLKVTNEYLSFGGSLSADLVDGVTVAVFRSPAPLLRRGGHSQGWDQGAETLGAFLGRFKIAVDYAPGFERRIGAATPLTRYAAFVADVVGRYRRSAQLRSTDAETWRLFAPEEARLQRDHPAEWADGVALLEAAHAV